MKDENVPGAKASSVSVLAASSLLRDTYFRWVSVLRSDEITFPSTLHLLLWPWFALKHILCVYFTLSSGGAKDGVCLENGGLFPLGQLLWTLSIITI